MLRRSDAPPGCAHREVIADVPSLAPLESAPLLARASGAFSWTHDFGELTAREIKIATLHRLGVRLEWAQLTDDYVTGRFDGLLSSVRERGARC